MSSEPEPELRASPGSGSERQLAEYWELSAPGPQRVRDKTEYCSFDAGLWRDSRAKVLRRFRPSAGRVNYTPDSVTDVLKGERNV